MASIAICPHCYLQLIVPDDVESDEQVECPTCAMAFDLDQAVVHTVPEVVRRSSAVAPAEEPLPETPVPTAAADEAAEAEVLVDELDGQREAAVIEDVKTRIEAEIAANRLHPNTNVTLPLDLPGEEGVVDATTQAANEAVESGEAKSEEDAFVQEEPESDIAPEPGEAPQLAPPAATPEDPMLSREEVDELDEALGPSFDLPNVPLVPSNGATVEVDPNVSFGTAAETEFELDDVDFAAMHAPVPTADEVDEANEPVFSEPAAPEAPAEPFVLPAMPRPRKKRSVARTLINTALSGAIGLSLGYFILLYLRGPEVDFLHVAQYIPTALLPKSFSSQSTQLAEATRAPAPFETAAASRTDNTDSSERDESANVPAAYSEDVNVPAESVATDEPPNDDRYGTEPPPLEEPAAEPIADETPHATVVPLPLRGPTFTVDQLSAALKAGKEAQAGLITGDLSDASVRRTKGMSYSKLCDLAEALTFVDRSASPERERAIEDADRLFHQTLTDTHTRDEVARIVPIWIDSPHRAHGGIFLAAVVSGGQIAGDVYQYELAGEYNLVDDDGDRLSLLMQEPLDPSVEGSGRPIGIVGSIVDNPAEQIAGYQGTAKRAIWVTRAIPLD